MSAAVTTSPHDAGSQYLSFFLAGEEYAVDILAVREIRGLSPITPLPNTPPHVRGVMNLRGAVVPVVDLRVALRLPPSEYGRLAVIVVLAAHGRTMGFIADSVCDVVSLDPSDVESVPDFGARADSSLVAGIGRVAKRFVLLLDADKIADAPHRVSP